MGLSRALFPYPKCSRARVNVSDIPKSGPALDLDPARTYFGGHPYRSRSISPTASTDLSPMTHQPAPSSWRFRAMAPSEPNQNPFQGEFFSADLPQRFVRESVQNSLDARAGREPVTVRFTISGPGGAVSAERADRYLTGFRPHFEAVVRAESANVASDRDRRQELERRTALLDGPLPFLVVEDFGTTGLQGDIRANEIRAEGNDFWGFFRSIGISPKDEDAGGSWGLGKWVFPDASKLNAFIGITRRADERRFLVMGQAMLKLHELDGRKFPPVGFFAARTNEEDRDWLPMPVESAGLQPDDGEADRDENGSFARDAMRDFGLRPRGQPGTSVVIPHPMDELTDPGNLAYAVIRQYFHPIIAGDLVVEIASPGESTRTINTDTIEDEARRTPSRDSEDPEQQAEAVVGAMALARWGLRQRSGLVVADARRNKPAIAADQADQLRERYQNGERLAFRVRSWVRGKRNTFRVFLERDDGLAGGHDYYVRGHLHIPGMDFLSRHRARALVVVDNKSDLGHLLRDAEGPSHEKWRADAPRLKEKGWPAAAMRVREVQHAAARILDALAEKPVEVQRDALSDLFPGTAGERPGPGPVKPLPPDVTPKEKTRVRVKRVRNGFELAPAGAHDLSGEAFEVYMAYDVARGTTKTALSRFDRGLRAGCPDFSLRNGRLTVESHQCKLKIRSENEVHVCPEGPEFSFKVTGFDERDVVVKVVPRAPEIDESDSGEA